MSAEKYFDGVQLGAYAAARNGDVAQLQKAVASGALDLNLPGREDMTLLVWAVLSSERKAIVSLIQAGADPDQVIPGAGSAAVLAVTKFFAPPRTDAIAALFDGGYQPNRVSAQGKPFLFYFVDYKHWPGLQLALLRGADINMCNSDGVSLLTYALQHGELDVARGLIGSGASVALRGKRNETALRALESFLQRASPSQRKRWSELLAMRQLLLSKLADPSDRKTKYTEAVEQKIRDNP